LNSARGEMGRQGHLTQLASLAASAATYPVFLDPTFRFRPTGLSLHAGLVAVNRYRGKGRVFFATAVAESD